jgi:hypothetical protein
MRGAIMLRTKRTVIAVLALVLIAGACDDEAAPVNNVDAGLPKLTQNLENGLTRVITLPGEKFTVTTTYTTPYRGSWNITDNKSLDLALRLSGSVPEGAIVYVEHFHADVTLMSTKAAFNGMIQDSMDDSMHGGSEPGFLVSATYPYATSFSIDGYSQTLISGWSFQNGDFGTGEISEKRLTENNLKKDGGVTGNKLTFVYDLLVKYPNDAGFHKVAVTDAFAVPVS